MMMLCLLGRHELYLMQLVSYLVDDWQMTEVTKDIQRRRFLKESFMDQLYVYGM